MKKQLLALALSLAALNLVAQEAPLPNPAAPFQVLKGSRLDPLLKVGAFVRDGKTYDQPSLVIGNKRIGVRESSRGFETDSDQVVCLFVDNRQILSFSFWGAQAESGSGYPFKLKEGAQAELKANEADKTITYSKPYVLPGGGGATFTYTLKALTGSKVELSWDLGISQEKLETLPKDFGVGLWMVSPENDGYQPFLVNKQPLPLADASKLTPKEEEIRHGDGLELVYSPEKPLQGFTLSLPEDHSFGLNAAAPSHGKKQAGFIIRAGSKARLSHDKVVIDFGEVAEKDAAAPEPVAGIDFWERDRTCVPAPSTRNLMPNPSFEQGLRYWAWWFGGGKYVPSEIPAYSVVDGGKFGRKCLQIQQSQGGQPMQSFSIPLVKDKTYTLSFYAKAEKPNSDIVVGIQSPVQGSQFGWQKGLNSHHKLNTEWERKTITFTADQSAISVLIAASSVARLDGLQLEEGSAPTEFVAPEIEGFLRTSDPDNALAAGAPLKAVFEMYGKPGAKGEVDLIVTNYYREKVYGTRLKFTLDKEGKMRAELPWESAKLGTGVFIVKADYRMESGATLCDYYRLSIMDFLENKHATKDIFGNLCAAGHVTRGDDLARAYMRWGFGSTTYGMPKDAADLYAKYRIGHYLSIISDLVSTPEDRALSQEAQTKWTEVTPEREKQIEDLAYRIASAYPWVRSWAFSTETEGRSPMLIKGNYAEWAKIQLAAQRGVKRALPNAIVLPDGGTSGFGALRGARETEGYFAATAGKVKWDAVATHPYGNIDGVMGGGDLDVETTRMLDLMKKYGYGAETPLDYTEGFNINDLFLPEWGLSANGLNNDVYNSGRPSYDTGWQEFRQASWVARTYIICLKYWPQVRSFNIWVSRPYLDLYLAPLYACKVPNTLGHLLGNPKFKANIQPAAGVRGYVFEDEQGRGVAALWCTIDKVEEGLERGPVVKVEFKGKKLPEFIDLMGNARKVKAKKGLAAIQLTPAPLFIRTDKGGADKLIAALNGMEVEGAGLALKVNVLPTLGGGIEATLTNQTNRPLKGEVAVGKAKTAFETAAQGEGVYPVAPSQGTDAGKLYPWKQSLDFQFPGGRTDKLPWNMAYFYVPHAAAPLPLDPAAPQWEAIPAIPLTNRHVNEPAPGQEPVKAGYPGDLDAKFQLAWDKENLYLRISAKDDQFVLTEAAKWKDRDLYMHDGCAEVYFDAGANGRSNTVKGYDLDDYRYDFAMGNPEGTTGPGKVYRFAEAFHQLAGGIDMPTKADAAKNVKCQFQRTADGYAYVIIFAQRYIEPLHLEKGFRAGFGLYLHDKDDAKLAYPNKGVGLTTEPGVTPDRRPDLWPIMILKD